MYFALFIITIILALLSIKMKDNKVLINIYLFVILAMMCFRYGQGTDYFAYKYLFNQSNIYSITSSLVHGEIGFKILCKLFFGNYELFIAVISIYEILMLKIFLDKNSPKKFISILIFFPTIFITYYLSALRQGIVLATILGCISLIENKKWKKFIIIVLVLSTIHIVAIVYLIIPLWKKISSKTLVVLLPFSLIIGILIGTDTISSILFKLPIINKYDLYNSTSISISMISEKILTLFIVLFLAHSIKNNKEEIIESWWYKSYVLGHIIFFTLIAFPIIAGRIIICFKVLEIYFIPLILLKSQKSKLIGYMYFILVAMVMYVHNINGSIEQGNYYDKVNYINYPYINIFNKEKIEDYRNINKNLMYTLTVKE